MVPPAHLEILQQGVEAWTAWRRQNSDVTSTPDSNEAGGRTR